MSLLRPVDRMKRGAMLLFGKQIDIFRLISSSSGNGSAEILHAY